MAILRLIDDETGGLAELIQLCGQGPINEVLPRRILEQLGDLLDAHVVQISGLNPAVQVAQLCGPGDGDCHPDVTQIADGEVVRPFWRHYWFTEPISFTRMQHELTLPLAAFDGAPVQLTCWRPEGPDFDEACHSQLAMLKPHLEQAYAPEARRPTLRVVPTGASTPTAARP